MFMEKVEHTARGFEIINFRDHYGQECSLQQSSLALYETPGTSAIWLGVGEERMHLTDEQVGVLIQRLSNWHREGTFVCDNKDNKDQD